MTTKGNSAVVVAEEEDLVVPAVPTGKKGFLETTIAGGVGGACLVLSGHPLDTIKVRIQTMKTPAPGEAPMYTSALDCARKTVQKEGFRGLYKGVTAPLTAVTPMYSLCFFGYEFGKRIFTTEDDYKNLNLLPIAAAGATSAIFSTPIQAPQERIKCVMQVQETKTYNGMVDCGKALLREGGTTSLFRGFWATMGRDGLASAFYFSTYEFCKNKFASPDGSISSFSTLTAGGIAGMLNWLFAIPIDTLKSRLQVAPDGQYPNGIRSVFVDVMKTDGPKALFRGLGPIMLRAFPANAACFLGYETAIKVIYWVKS